MATKKTNKIPKTASHTNVGGASSSTAVDIGNVTQPSANEQPEQPSFFDVGTIAAVGVPLPAVVRSLLHTDVEPTIADHIVSGSAAASNSSGSAAASNRARRRQTQPKQHGKSKDVAISNRVKAPLHEVSVSIEVAGAEGQPTETLVLPGAEGQPTETLVLPSGAHDVKRQPQNSSAISLPVQRDLRQDAQATLRVQNSTAVTQQPTRYVGPQSFGVLSSRASPFQAGQPFQPGVMHGPQTSAVIGLPVQRELPCISSQPLYPRYQSYEPPQQYGASGSNRAPSESMRESLANQSAMWLFGAPALAQLDPQPLPPPPPAHFPTVLTEDEQDGDQPADAVQRAIDEQDERKRQTAAHREFMQVQRTNLQILRQQIPLDAKEKPTSIGSIPHSRRECTACVFNLHKSVCPNGLDCSFCHYSSHRRLTKRKKISTRGRYLRTVDNLAYAWEKDPDKFVIDVMSLPPSIKDSEAALERLVVDVQERIDLLRQVRLMEALHEPRPGWDTGVVSTQVITASGMQATLALISL